jgi:hypothetical protein
MNVSSCYRVTQRLCIVIVHSARLQWWLIGSTQNGLDHCVRVYVHYQVTAKWCYCRFLIVPGRYPRCLPMSSTGDTNAGSPAAPPPPPATPGAAGTDGTSVTLPYSCNPLDPRSLAVLVKYTRAQLAAASGSTAAPQTQPPANNDITPIILQGLIALEGLALIQEGGVRNAGPVQDLTLSHVTLVTSHTSAAPGTTDLEAAVSAVAASVCAVHVSGPLAPGRYNLILAGARHNMSINVLKPPLKPDPPPAATTPEPSSASAGGNRPSLALGPTSRLLLGATQLAEQVELQPLTIVSLTAVASEGVRLVVAGAPHELEGASAVITLSRFVPLTHAQAAQVCV